MHDIILSPCTVGDLPDLLNLAQTTYQQHFANLWHDNGKEYLTRHFTEQKLIAEIKAARTAFYMIYFQGRLVGFLELKVASFLIGYTASDALELARTYLLKDATGKGIGQQVMDFTVRLAREKQKRVVWLKVMDSSTDAIRFYQKAGFVKCATQVLDMPLIKKEQQGMHLMKLDLAPAAAATNRQARAAGSTNQKKPKKEVYIG